MSYSSDKYSYFSDGFDIDSDEQEWNYEKIEDYFLDCMEQFSPFNLNSSSLSTELMKFVNDEDHQGPEAEASKSFVNDKIVMLLIDTVRSVQILEGMMGVGFEEVIPLLLDFCDTLGEDETALIKLTKLNDVMEKFSAFNRLFRCYARSIETHRSKAQDIITGCDVTSYIKLTKPDPEPTHDALDDFVSTDSKEGFVPEFRDLYAQFLEAHNDDFTGSEFMSLIDKINTNLDAIEAGLGDGEFDLLDYPDKFSDIVYDEGGSTEAYDKYIDQYKKYLKGLATKNQIYKYDPVNMNSGNFVSSCIDLAINNRYPIAINRFYNALSDKIGVLGRGWTLNFEEHLSKNGDKFNLYKFDGKECVFEETTLAGEQVYLEIHGDPGVLRVKDNCFVITYDNGDYTEYDLDGYITGRGNVYGQHTSIKYELFNKDTEGNGVLQQVALPVMVETKADSRFILRYNQLGLLTSVEDHTGRVVSYKYEDESDALVLTSIIAANGAVRSYTYNENGLIASSIRPDGVVGVINEYDSKNRITHQTMPDGGEFKYRYDDNKHVTYATEANGCKVEYLSDELGRHVGTCYPDFGISESFTYNNKGLKTSHTDKNGNVTRYTYDNRGRLTGIIGPEGLNEHYTYNAEGKLYSKKDSEGNVTKFTYDLDGNLYSVSSEGEDKVKFDYEDGKVTAIRKAYGLAVTFTYDDKGNINSVIDEAGVKTDYEYDELGRVTAVINADGARTSFVHDEDDNIIQTIDPDGNMRRYEYNKLGKVSAIINPDGTSRRWEFNSIGEPSSYTDEENRTTKFFYNLSAQTEKIILANSGITVYEHDQLGNVTAVIDPDGNKTAYTHDNEGNVLSVTRDVDGKDAIDRYTYDGMGRIVTHTDPEGNQTKYEYDNNGNEIAVIDPAGGISRKEYDSFGRVVKKIDPLGGETIYTYDLNGKLISSQDPYGVITDNIYAGNRVVKIIKRNDEEEIEVCSYTYDSCGRIKTVTEGDGYIITYNYTPGGNIKSVSGSDGRSISYLYDACDRIIEENKNGVVTKYSYTGTGKIKCVTDSLGYKAEYTYNELDLLLEIKRTGEESSEHPEVTSDGHVTVYEYSLGGQLIGTVDALGHKDEYTYDGTGNVTRHVDRDGYETVYTRDRNGNVIGVEYQDGKSVRFKYNALNALEEIQDYLGLTRIESDILGRTTKVSDYKNRTVEYEYGPYNQRSAVVYPDGKRVEYKYDKFGRLDNVADVSYEYDKIGRLKAKSLPNGIRTAYDYYEGGLIKEICSTDSEGILDKYLYTYDKNYRVSDIERNRRGLNNISGKYHYEYDTEGRLIKSSIDGRNLAEYDYDAYGNRIRMTESDVSTTYTYDAMDRLTKAAIDNKAEGIKVHTYSYDNRGNQTAIRSGDVLKKSFDFDARGKLVSVIDDVEGCTKYNYNGLGYRVECIKPDEKIEYFCDMSKEYCNLLERTVNGEAETFVYDDNVVSMNKAGAEYYYLQDEIGSTMYLTGTDGNIVNAYAYDDFGRNVDLHTGRPIFGRNKSYSKNGNIIQPFAFTGYLEEDDSNLKFAQARYYDAEAGRFQSEDSVKGYTNTPVTLNRYAYCWNNPISYVDRDGNWPDWVNKAANYVSEHKQQIIGTAITVVGTAAGVAAQVAITAVCPAAAPLAAAVGGAISGAASSVGSQVAEKGFGNIDLGEVAVDTAAGALGGLCGSGAGTSVAKTAFRVVAPAVIDGAAEGVKSYMRDGKVDWKSVGKTTATSLAFNGIGEGLSRLKANKLRKMNADDIPNDKIAKLDKEIGSDADRLKNRINTNQNKQANASKYVNKPGTQGSHARNAVKRYGKYVQRDMDELKNLRLSKYVSNAQSHFDDITVPLITGTGNAAVGAVTGDVAWGEC